jgi:UDP-N-acetylmuramoylalanine-D-glutamate ligase
VKPWLLKDYDGSDIVLNEEKNIVMKVSDFPNLKNYIHQDLVLTDGTTLLGGDDKGTDLAELVAQAEAHCKAVICFGEAGPRFLAAFADSALPHLPAGKMADALDVAITQAEPGDIICLSPACASFDEFSGFEERGRVFKQLVATRSQERGV